MKMGHMDVRASGRGVVEAGFSPRWPQERVPPGDGLKPAPTASRLQPV